jgi:outer membrane protein TolC
MTAARRCLCAALLLAAAPLSAREPGPLDFGEAVRRMRAGNEALAAGGAEVRQRLEEGAAAKGLRSPKVTVEARETFLNDRITIEVESIGFSYRVQEDQFLKGQVKVSWPVYTGGRIDAANAAAAAKTEEAAARLNHTDQQLVTELARRYFGLRLARQAAEVAALKTGAMERHHRHAARLFGEGIIARVEALNAEVALANARAEQSAAERDAAIAAEGLANALADPSPGDPATPLFIVRDLEPVEWFQDGVEHGHPALEALEALRRQAEEGVRAEKGAALPTVYLFGLRELFPNDLTLLDPEWAAGIGGEYTLFDGGQTKHRTAAARAQADRVALLAKKARRDLRSLVAVRHQEAGKALEQHDAFKETLALAEENLRVRMRAFEEGVATSVEVVDASLSLARAQLGRLKAAYDFDTALFGLLEAAGRTDAHGGYLARGVPVDAPAPAVPALDLPAPAPPDPKETPAK